MDFDYQAFKLTKIWEPEVIFYAVFVFSWITFIWDFYLTYRQYKIYKYTTKVPFELSGLLELNTLEKARCYNIDKTRFGFYHSIWNQILTSIILWFDLLPSLWKFATYLNNLTGYEDNLEILRTIIFMVFGALFMTFTDLPWSIYNVFVIEEKHGFNKQTLAFYIKDKTQKFILSQVISVPIMILSIYIINIGGKYLFIYLWVFTSLVSLLLISIYPEYIAPLFDKYSPLPEGELRDAINELANSVNFPLKKIFIVEGSKRSSHSNAYLYGFFNHKRIVLYDTLIENYQQLMKKDEDQTSSGNTDDSGENSDNAAKLESKITEKRGCNQDEILSVLSHELGHWKLNHTIIQLVIGEIQLLFTFALFGFLYKDPVIYKAFGFDETPVMIGLFIIFQFIFSPYNEITGFLMTCLTRRNEFAADAYAKKLNRSSDLRNALIKLHKDNLSFPIYDWLFSAYNLSHPPLLERIKALSKID